MSHIPVLLEEVLQALDPHPGDFMIDGTIDGGNHAAAIMKKLSPGGTLLGVDWDERLLAKTRERFQNEFPREQKNIILMHGNYADLPDLLLKVFETKDLGKADGLLLDLGFSSEQLAGEPNEAGEVEVEIGTGRGFSFSDAAKDEPLLMTYSDTSTPVAQLLREIDEATLANIIYEFGGERMSRRIAKAINDRGRRKPIATAGELADTIRAALPKNYERGRIDPATRTFQALRIYANSELDNVKRVLGELPEIVKSGGRVAIITFHSLEDRIVKHAFQAMAKEHRATLLTKKPIAATREEIQHNPRTHSAKLRTLVLLPVTNHQLPAP